MEKNRCNTKAEKIDTYLTDLALLLWTVAAVSSLVPPNPGTWGRRSLAKGWRNSRSQWPKPLAFCLSRTPAPFFCRLCHSLSLPHGSYCEQLAERGQNNDSTAGAFVLRRDFFDFALFCIQQLWHRSTRLILGENCARLYSSGGRGSSQFSS